MSELCAFIGALIRHVHDVAALSPSHRSHALLQDPGEKVKINVDVKVLSQTQSVQF